MKKLLIPIAVVAVGASAYLYQQKEQQPAYNVLNYVPADTPIFSGQLAPFPLKDYLTSFPSLDNTQQIKLSDAFGYESPGINFTQNIIDAYQEAVKTPSLLATNFGLADQVRAYAYTIGLLPVVKIEVADPQVFWDLLDKNEQETGFTHTDGKLNEQPYRSYQLTEDDDQIKVELIVSQANGLFTFTLKSDIFTDQALAMALEQQKPEKSLADTGTITEIAKKHNLSESSIGFVNHVEIVKGLTTTDGNLIAKQLTELLKNESRNPLTAIQSTICQQEFNSIAQNWPRTAFGYTQLDIDKDQATVGFSAIIESKNQVILNSLNALRGFIPEYTQGYDDKVASFAYGFDVSKLSSSLTNIFSDLSTPSYQCAELQKMQADITQAGQQLAMVGIGANMASGLKGISGAIYDYDLSDLSSTTPQLNSLDGLFSIHADSPKALFDSLKMLAPIPALDLVVDGPAVALKSIMPIPPELNIDPQVAIKGNHFVIYNGEKATKAAEALSTEKLSSNGVAQIALDLPKLLAPVLGEIEKSDEILPAEIQNLKDYDMRMKGGLDFTEQGIRIDSTVNSKAVK